MLQRVEYPRLRGQLAYRKRVAKLIFGYRDIAGGRAVLGGTRAVLLVTWALGQGGEVMARRSRRPLFVSQDRGHLGRRINNPLTRPAPTPELGGHRSLRATSPD
jgi:hypothetical protein